MHLADGTPYAGSMDWSPAAAASGAQQQHKDSLVPPLSPLLELHELLRSAKGHMVPARALSIIRASSAEELAAYMLLLVNNSAPSAAAPPPASHRLTIALHDAASPPGPAAAAEGVPDSPRRCGKHDQQLGASSSPEPASSSGRCFLAESLDLNVGASCDWLVKGSLADFSAATAAAAARASRSGLVGASMAAQRMLSPVAENSLPHTAAAYDPQEEQPCSHSATAAAAAEPEWGDVPSCCSSPREGPSQLQHLVSAAASQVSRAALVRQSAAESALDWPRALPVAVDAFTVDAEDAASLASSAAPSPQPAQLASRHTPPRGQAAAPLLPHYSEQQQQARGQGSFTSNASNDSAGSSSKRTGGGGLGRALLAPVNALRRSLTGGRVAAAAPSSSSGRAGALQSAAGKPLARGSAPVAGVYGHRGGAASPGGGSTSSRQHTVSPALGSRLASFTVTREGASPTKTAAAAASSGRKQPAAGWGGSGTSSRVTGNTSYRPPSTPCSTSNSRSPGATASSSRIGAGSKPASGSSRLPGAPPGQQQQFRRSPASDAGCGPHGSDLRSERSCPHYGAAASAGSHTSGGGAIPGFRATKQMLDGAAHTPLARPQHARGAVAAAARANVRAQDKQVSPGVAAARGGAQQQQGGGGSPAGSTFSSRLQPSRLPSVFAGPTQQQQQQQHSVISVFAGPASSQARGAGSSGSRIGRGSQLRRSRSCGSLGELAKPTAAATASPARQQAQHSIRHCNGGGAADTAVQLLEPGLPLLSLCYSPTKNRAHPWAEPGPVLAGGSSSTGDPASLLLDRMDALIARAGTGRAAAAMDNSDGCFLSPAAAGGAHPLARKMMLGAAARGNPMPGGSTPLDAGNPVASPLDTPPLCLSGLPTPVEARCAGGAAAAADITRQLF